LNFNRKREHFTRIPMARKMPDGSKISKKSIAKDKKNYNSYNQKTLRLKQELIEKRKMVGKIV